MRSLCRLTCDEIFPVLFLWPPIPSPLLPGAIHSIAAAPSRGGWLSVAVSLVSRFFPVKNMRLVSAVVFFDSHLSMILSLGWGVVLRSFSDMFSVFCLSFLSGCEFGCGVSDLRMQDRTIALVGDSLGRQQFQSLMCMITGGRKDPRVKDVGKEYGFTKARKTVRPSGWAYRFQETNTTILYHWSASLCELEPLNVSDPATNYAMHLDRPANFLSKYLHRFDVLVLNTGHHWNREKFRANRWEMYVDGKKNTNTKLAAIGDAKNLTIHSVVKWLDSRLPHLPHLKAFLRTVSPRHFVNGEWNSGGSCGNTVPLAAGSEVSQDGSGDPVAEAAVRGTAVKLLGVTALSLLRDEGHISRYGIKASQGRHDCLHWCLPGVPDTWNEILYSQI
ncbi:hypothetical protein BHE74_00049032 [Ensete ventricosum]|nr:hypothetical protein GW17_00043079 [Ensete ventricosum]RWW45160.1 hypothetical protein BHE74_00049032 [Ensete ventricosum]